MALSTMFVGSTTLELYRQFFPIIWHSCGVCGEMSTLTACTVCGHVNARPVELVVHRVREAAKQERRRYFEDPDGDWSSGKSSGSNH